MDQFLRENIYSGYAVGSDVEPHIIFTEFYEKTQTKFHHTIAFYDECYQVDKFFELFNEEFPDEEVIITPYSSRVTLVGNYQDRHYIAEGYTPNSKKKKNSNKAEIFTTTKSIRFAKRPIMVYFDGCIIHNDPHIFEDDLTDKVVTSHIELMHIGEEEIVTKLIDILKKCFAHKKKESMISYIMVDSHGGYRTKDASINVPKDIDLDLYYGDELVRKNDIIIKALSDPSASGLISLVGEPGTGKTTYIKHLVSKVDTDFLFLPNQMVNVLTNPDFLTYLYDNMGKIMVIEDAEKVLVDRENDYSGAGAVSNILNLTDGMMGDSLRLKIITTQNLNIDRNDKALYRKGRLIAEHTFDKIPMERAKRIRSDIDPRRITEDLTLGDIFHMDSEGYNVEQTKIGF